MIFQLYCVLLVYLCGVTRIRSDPTCNPTRIPTRIPTRSPTTIAPTHKPIATPTAIPTATPSVQPTSTPTVTIKPSPLPSSQPSSGPSSQPTSSPSLQPFASPSSQPTGQPSFAPTSPTSRPTSSPQNPTVPPTVYPTFKPTWSRSPSRAPTYAPTRKPSVQPTVTPTRKPTYQPTIAPSMPTSQPSSQPSRQPSRQPSGRPTSRPTSTPTNPTSHPSCQPTGQPTSQPSNWPSSQPTSRPSKFPQRRPTPVPSSYLPSFDPSSQPSSVPSSQPSSRPTAEPTITKKPTFLPTSQPSCRPSAQPSSVPSMVPTAQPTMSPSSPSSQPSSAPSAQPSSQPSSRPSVQPSSQPSGIPSGQPSFAPTSPTSQPSSTPSVPPTPKPSPIPTVNPNPTSQPSSQPSALPSAQPSSFPTTNPTLSYFPTSSPSKLPTPKPTAQPTFFGGIPYTLRPTAFYETVSAEGTVEFEPDALAACNPVQIRMSFTFTKNITAGSTILINTPGMTTGPCYSATDGSDITSLYIPTGYFQGSYHEGSYLDNYATSSMSFVIGSGGIAPSVTYTLYIDRSNQIRRSCSTNTAWEVTIIPNNGRIAGRVGTLSLIETYPKRCFVFQSDLYFQNAVPQFYTGINATLRLGYEITAGTVITLHLPGFTNSVGAYPLNVLQDNATAFRAVRNGFNTVLYDIKSSTNFTWAGQWFEGSFTDNFASSRIVLTAYGFQAFNDLFWVEIPKSRNHLIPVCGHPPNDPTLRISTRSTFYYSNSTSVGSSSIIGPGCGPQDKCSGNGVCDYCTSTCTCNEGFGSVEDRARSIADDFLPDCSSRSCPVGPSMGTVVSYSVAVPRNDNFTLNVENHMHKLMECSNNGICNRKTGMCKCAPGFEGAACQKMKCGGMPVCSGRGKCLPMDRLARSLEALPLSTRRVFYTSQNESRVESWDGQLGHTCVCDSSWPVGLMSGQTQLAEFFGPTCENRRCPSGDDPNTRSVDETDCEGVAQTGGGVEYRERGRFGNKCHIDCSNRGTCNYQTGVCTCFQGFTGDNCATYKTH